MKGRLQLKKRGEGHLVVTHMPLTFPHAKGSAFLYIYEGNTTKVICHSGQPAACCHADGEAKSWFVW